MKRTLFALLTLAVLALPTWAEDIDLPQFAPMTPEIKGQGGTVVSATTGYNTLFGNPAAFASKNGSLTLLSLVPTANLSLGAIKDSALTYQKVMETGFTDITKVAGILDDFLAEGIGAQLAGGTGVTVGGLGIGAAVQGGVLLKEPGKGLVAGTTAKLDITEGLIIGYAIPLDLSTANVRIGLDVRAMQRTYSEYSLADIASLMALKIAVANGFGLAFDIGAQADFGELTVGLAIRDLGGTKFGMKTYNIADVFSGLTFPTAAPLTGDDDPYAGNTYTTAMTITPALSWTPDLGLLGILVQPRLTAEITVPVLSAAAMPSFWASTHFGAEVKLLSFLALRAGLNQGYLTMGFGAHLLFLDANIAVYSDELGTVAGQNKKSGLAAEVALRF